LVCCEESYTGLFSVVAHEDRDEQCQHENCTEQVENDEVYGVTSGCEILGLPEDSSDSHARVKKIGPSFLRNNLEQDEE
jgi:hypothetical protein